VNSLHAGHQSRVDHGRAGVRGEFLAGAPVRAPAGALDAVGELADAANPNALTIVTVVEEMLAEVEQALTTTGLGPARGRVRIPRSR
jgi:hypothetical protein